jgi:uncharacterized protein DUF4253
MIAEEDEEIAAGMAPFGPGFPGLAPPGQTALSDAELQRALDSLAPARIGLVPVGRPADVLAALGWDLCFERLDTLPLTAVLRSWENRFGARLLEVGFADIKLLVERPPRDLSSAQRIAAEHCALADECANHAGPARTTIPQLAPSWSARPSGLSGGTDALAAATGVVRPTGPGRRRPAAAGCGSWPRRDGAGATAPTRASRRAATRSSRSA